MTDHLYTAFGLTVESAWPIASLLVADADVRSPPDVTILERPVRSPPGLQAIDGLQVKVEGDICFLEIPECGRFQVVGGREIVVEPEPGTTREQINLYLLGSVFGVLLHQRGMLPFHCNAVEFEGRAFLFCGDSGAGKSTLAAFFVERGLRLLSDDMCALDFEGDGKLSAVAGAARLKLWEDTLRALGRSSEGLKLVPWYDDKFELPLSSDDLARRRPVAALYHLRTAEDGRRPGIHPLGGLDAVNSVTANIYRRRLADLLGAAPAYLAATGRIVGQVPIFAVNRKWGFDHFRDEAMVLESHMREVAREASEEESRFSEPARFRAVEQ